MRASWRHTAPPLRHTRLPLRRPYAANTLHKLSPAPRCMPLFPSMPQHSTPSASTMPVLQPAARPRATPTPLLRLPYAAITPPLRRPCRPSHYATTTPHSTNPQAITPQIPNIAPLWHHPTGHAQKVPHAPPSPANWPLYFWGALLLRTYLVKVNDNSLCAVYPKEVGGQSWAIV